MCTASFSLCSNHFLEIEAEETQKDMVQEPTINATNVENMVTGKMTAKNFLIDQVNSVEAEVIEGLAEMAVMMVLDAQVVTLIDLR